ncbi:hypothetical protein [Thalassospira sp. CH_XMU1420-2]|jgi:hypothetical protein|uniref:hypothetical protein n=1 Tax=Thalassospira sp. CH_XMU1420-2 TaxID=3107769 RepID=UPI00300AF990
MMNNEQLVVVTDLASRDLFAFGHTVPCDLANEPMLDVLEKDLAEQGYKFERLAKEGETRVGLFYNRHPDLNDDVQIAIVCHAGETWEQAGNRFAARSGCFSSTFEIEDYRGLQYLEFVGWVDEFN